MSDIIFGIDLGTTNSCISFLDEKNQNRPRVIPVDGNGIVPSVVSLDGEEFLVGRRAYNRAIAYPDQSVRSVKRLMGSNLPVTMNSRIFRPEEVSAKILGYLMEETKRLEGLEVERAVITVPAYFSDSQRRATIEAGQLAGLDVVRIIHEPTAASLFYDMVKVSGNEDDGRKWSNALVYDLGGGTFDVSVLRMGDIIEVVSSTGDTKLGGDDFDQLLVVRLLENIKKNHDVDLSNHPPAMARLRNAAEKAKIALSEKASYLVEETYIPVPKGDRTVDVSMEFLRTEVEKMSERLINKTLEFVSIALKEASLTPSSIDRVILVGGMTRMPIVTQALTQIFGQSQLPAVDPDLSVANGAAIQGGIITGVGTEQILVDVTSHTLSVEAMCYDSLKCVPIIPRNTSIPATRSRIFYTSMPGQQVAKIRIFQGEGEDPEDNNVIGVKNLSLSASPQGTEILVEYSYDKNGVVHVVAEQRGYSRKMELKIDSRNPQNYEGERLERNPDVIPFNPKGSDFEDEDDDDDDFGGEFDPASLFQKLLGMGSKRPAGSYHRSAQDADALGADGPPANPDIREFSPTIRKPGQAVNYVVRQVNSVLGKLPPYVPEKKKLEEMLERYQAALADHDGDEAMVDKHEEEILDFIDSEDVSKYLR
ncbi:MAG: Hsp70 family protein [Deltaproteobacteria bacterium]|jgi:molecular chaperone DnaK|nr:Hsp70 family protein [Deltaproteobacteria bacterium]